MKLAKAYFIEHVSVPGNGTTKYLDGTSAKLDSFSFEGGFVVCVKGDQTIMIPVHNVSFLTPAPKAAK